VTDPIRPTDDELFGRIRRSMDHYRFAGALRSAHRPSSWWRVGALLAAALTGAVLAVAVLGMVGDLRLTPPRVGGPTASPATPGPSTGPSVQPSPTRPPLVISDARAAEACLTLTQTDVADGWGEPGETNEQVIAEFASLPLLIADRREHGSVFLYGDNRFDVVCQFLDTGGPTPDLGISREPREAVADVIEYSGGRYTGGVVDANGNPVGLELPDILMHGTVDPDVARIELVLDDGTTRDARLAAGYWMIWLQEGVGTQALRAYDADGVLRRELEHVRKAVVPTNDEMSAG